MYKQHSEGWVELVSFDSERVATAYSGQKQQHINSNPGKVSTVKNTRNALKGFKQGHDWVIFFLQKNLQNNQWMVFLQGWGECSQVARHDVKGSLKEAKSFNGLNLWLSNLSMREDHRDDLL